MKRNNSKTKNKIPNNYQNKSKNNLNDQIENENELYDDNIEYELPSSLKNDNIQEEDNNSLDKDAYIEELELKIQQQSKTLSELNKYKFLCEKRIKQLNPNEILPLTIESLKDESNINNNNNLNNKDIHKKYELLNDKFQKLLNDYNDIIKNNNIHDISTNTINAVNINDKYKILKEKYKKIKEENKKIIEVLKEETKACEMQKNIIDVLQQAIDNDISKNNELKKFITIDNIVDFTQLKMEAEQYRKELVLSQALVNSLKSEIEQLNKEKEEAEINNNNNNIKYNKNINNNIINDNLNEEENDNNQNQENDEINMNNNMNNNYYKNNNNNQENNNLLMSENISLKTTLNSQAQLIKELMDENQNLKKLVDEATIKLNDVINNKNENKINNDNLNYQLNLKINEIKQYEDKFIYFNDYITIIKSIFMNFQDKLPKYINSYNKIANEDLNSLLSNSFSQSIIKLNNRINQLNKLEKFNLETNIESDITNIILEFIQILNNEFISIYEKVFQTNSYYKESNKKIEELQLQIKENEITNQNNLKKINNINDLLNNEKKNMDECKNTSEEYKIKLAICHLEKDNLNKKIESYLDDKNSIIDCFYVMIKALSQYNENLSQLLRECMNIIETKSKLFNEKEIIMEQLTKNKIKDLNRDKLYKNNPEVNKMVTQEQITLQNLINEFENKINEKENQLINIKEKIKQYLLELQNRPLIQKNNINNNGINNNYNYNYYIRQDNSNNNGNNNIPEILKYNMANRNKLNNINNNARNIIPIHSFDSGNNNDINRNQGNNGTSYTYTSNHQNLYEHMNNINEQDKNEIENNK